MLMKDGVALRPGGALRAPSAYCQETQLCRKAEGRRVGSGRCIRVAGNAILYGSHGRDHELSHGAETGELITRAQDAAPKCGKQEPRNRCKPLSERVRVN